MNVKWFSIAAALLALSYWFWQHQNRAVNFNTQIKPLINKNCIACHGGVKQAGNYSLLFRQEALAKGKSGKAGIVPGHAEASEIIRRVKSNDPDEHMPKKGNALTKNEVALLEQWINEGANWGDHWAYLPLKKVEVPKKGLFASVFSWFGGSSWAKNDIDHFVEERLEQEGLLPSDEAEASVLLRRLCLDLTGLPPTFEKFPLSVKTAIKVYEEDNSDKNYEQVVNELLKTPQYGEKWGAMWLDLARYSDTKGYERDDARSIWQYRDWVIKAFNNDMPYNQFLTEQIAGDLLPKPSHDQLIATAFHRNTMTNDEGGTDNEEFRTAAVLERVNTTWEVLNSTTFACVQCHTHPYDPFRHEDYYKFAAFFNNTRDEDTFDDYPKLRTFKATEQSAFDSLTAWVQHYAPKRLREIQQMVSLWHPTYNSLTFDRFQKAELSDTKFLGIQHGGSARIPRVNLTGKSQFVWRYWTSLAGGTLTLKLDSLNGKVLTTIKIDTTGIWRWDFRAAPIAPTQGVHDVYLVCENRSLKNTETYGFIMDWLAFNNPFPKNLPNGGMAEKQFWRLMKARPEVSTPIMLENPADMARKSYVFERGNWLVHGPEVQPQVPKALGPWPMNAPKNRLGLAQWLTSPAHPLTARTAVNRFWEQIFGVGLVETLEDFGTQGISPTNPALLDHLSLRFMNEWHWQPKQLIRYIVSSATYQQNSKADAKLLDKDPQNRFLARGPRIRLSAEQIRDQALAISGLLSTKMYGPSVMPYQPEGVWQSPYDGRVWKQSEGEDQYRRAVYTYVKRTSPYPALMMFDGSSRETCLARRIRTNTPLQALVSLNDPAFVECAKYLALKMEKERKVEKQIEEGYRLTMNREITGAKATVLEELYEQTYQKFKNKPQEARQLLSLCADDNHQPQNIPARAALMVVANGMLNLDELVTKE